MVMKRKLASRPVADPLQVFNHACRFLATDQGLRGVFGGSDWALTIAPPTMVLSAFASELFLKCLLILETSEAPENIHLLHILYRRVSHKRRHACRPTLEMRNRGFRHSPRLPWPLRPPLPPSRGPFSRRLPGRHDHHLGVQCEQLQSRQD